MFEGLLRASTKVPAGTPYVPSKMFSTSNEAAMLNVVTHALAGSFDFRAAFLHLSLGGVVIFLSNT